MNEIRNEETIRKETIEQTINSPNSISENKEDEPKQKHIAKGDIVIALVIIILFFIYIMVSYIADVHKRGYEQGYKIGYEIGEQEGYKTGNEIGEENGYEIGYETGAEDGYEIGIQTEEYLLGFSDANLIFSIIMDNSISDEEFEILIEDYRNLLENLTNNSDKSKVDEFIEKWLYILEDDSLPKDSFNEDLLGDSSTL